MILDRRALLASLAATPFAGQGKRLHADDFRDLKRWTIEAEKPATVTAKDGVLDIVAPAGFTAWFKPELVGPVAITY